MNIRRFSFSFEFYSQLFKYFEFKYGREFPQKRHFKESAFQHGYYTWFTNCILLVLRTLVFLIIIKRGSNEISLKEEERKILAGM